MIKLDDECGKLRFLYKNLNAELAVRRLVYAKIYLTIFEMAINWVIYDRNN